MVGSEVREIRDILGLTQEELAARLKVKRLTIVRWEKSIKPIPFAPSILIKGFVPKI